MNRILATILLTFVCLGLSAMDWVHLGAYPYVYEGETNSWYYSTTPYSWLYSYSTGGWICVGDPEVSFGPEEIAGLIITFTAKDSGIDPHSYNTGYYFYTEDEGQYWYAPPPVGVVKGIRMKYKYLLTENSSAILAVVYDNLNQRNFILKFDQPVRVGYYGGSCTDISYYSDSDSFIETEMRFTLHKF